MDDAAALPDTTAPAARSFAAVFAEYLGTQGYTTSDAPELQGLRDSSDHVLVDQAINGTLVVAIVDRQAHPDKRTTIQPTAALEAAVESRRMSGLYSNHKQPAVLRLYEIGPGVLAADDINRLQSYRLADRSAHARVETWLVDTKSRRIWTNAPGNGGGARRAIEAMLRANGAPTGIDAEGRRVLTVEANPTPPFFTYALIVLLLAIFVAEVVFSMGPTGKAFAISASSLSLLGGASGREVLEGGQYWRLFTAPLLHLDISHVGFNCFALWLIGRRLEPLIGWRWTAGLFAVSAFCGAVASVLINPVNIVTAGASGGILGLFAAAVVVAFRTPAGKARSQLILRALYGLVPSLLPFFSTPPSGGMVVDYAAHLGGAIGGVLASLLLVRSWPADRPRPSRQRLALGAGAVFALGAVASLLPISNGYLNWSFSLPSTAPQQHASASLPAVAAMAAHAANTASHLSAGTLANAGGAAK
jgi:rhomboid protease GluP